MARVNTKSFVQRKAKYEQLWLYYNALHKTDTHNHTQQITIWLPETSRKGKKLAMAVCNAASSVDIIIDINNPIWAS